MATFSGTQAAHPSSSNPEHPFPALTSIFTIVVTTLTILHGALSSYETNYDTQESGPKEKNLTTHMQLKQKTVETLILKKPPDEWKCSFPTIS